MPEKTYRKQSLWRLLTLLRPGQGKYIAGLSSRVFLTTFERMFIGILLKFMVDAVTSANKSQFQSTLVAWIAFYIGFTLLAPFVLYLWRTGVFEGTANMREAIFRHIQRLPLGYHEVHHSGDALSILSNDAAAAEKAYQEDLYTLAEASVQGLSAAAIMLTMNWELTLAIILCGLAPLLVNTLFAGPLRKVGQEIQDSLGALSERMTDILAGFQVVRTFSLGDWILSRFSHTNEQVLERSLRRVRLESSLSACNELAGIGIFLPMALGAYFVMIGRTTLGTYLMLVQLSNQIYYLVYSLGGVISRVQSALAASDRIFALLDTPAEPERLAALPGADRPLSPQNSGALIEFRDVTFAYNGGENILKSISFSVSRGQFAAFAGPSGGGKSTLFKLLMGCYPVKSGAIFVAGRPLQDYNLPELRDLTAYVPQDAYLFSGTILENIRYGRPEASDAEIMEAARSAFAYDFVMAFPDGFQTVVGERGARLSGGQRQRIAIARALLKDAPILLLDEATSALDSESEQVVQKALQVLMQGRTTLVIAHRFSTIVHADIIYVIEAGQLVEQGAHTALMERQGVYAALYETQFKQNKEPLPTLHAIGLETA